MLHFLPSPYPDELWYSVLCRYHVRSGNSSPQQSSQDIFGHKKQKVSVELATDVQTVLDALAVPFQSAEAVLLNHTLLPFYARFWGSGRKQEVVRSLATKGGDTVHRVGIFQSGTSTARVFRYCPDCFSEDMGQFGEPYWHRAHQLGDIGVCVKHHCRLSATGMPMYNHQQIFRPATPDMTLVGGAHRQPSSQELDFAALLAENLWAPFDMEDGGVYARVFDYHLKQRGWRSPTGKHTQVACISKEMRGFFGGRVQDTDITADRLNSTFSSSKQPAPRFILQAAFFLRISLEELFVQPSQADTVQEIRNRLAAGESQRSVARALGVDASTIRRWSVGHEAPRKRQPAHRKPAAKVDWQAMDAACLPRLRALLEGVSQGRPERITFTWAAKALGTILAAQLKKMPRCASLIDSHIEPIEATWEKRLIWAKRQLMAEGKPVAETAVFRLAGVLKRRFATRIDNSKSP